MSELLKVEGVEAEEKAIRYVAKAGDGSMRDALSLLDQCIAFYLGQTLTYDKVLDVLGAVDTEVFSRLLRKVLAGDVTSAIRIPVSYTHLDVYKRQVSTPSHTIDLCMRFNIWNIFCER